MTMEGGICTAGAWGMYNWMHGYLDMEESWVCIDSRILHRLLIKSTAAVCLLPFSLLLENSFTTMLFIMIFCLFIVILQAPSQSHQHFNKQSQPESLNNQGLYEQYSRRNSNHSYCRNLSDNVPVPTNHQSSPTPKPKRHEYVTMAGGRSLAETPAQGVKVSACHSVHLLGNGAIDPFLCSWWTVVELFW
jgi:hypothetical protein